MAIAGRGAETLRSLVLVGAAFVAHFLTLGLMYSIGVYFVTFLEVFQGGSGLTSWIGSINMSVLCASGPLASVMMDRFSARVTVIVGGLLATAGLLLSAFATTIHLLFASYGVLTGFGYGLVFTSSVVVVNDNFDKYRAMAQGIAISGAGFGNFCFPFLIKFLMSLFGWRGSLIVISGLSLNICVMGALMRMRQPMTSRGTPTESETSSECCCDKGTEEESVKTHRRGSKKTRFTFCRSYPYWMLHVNTVLFCFGMSVVYTHICAHAEYLGFTSNESGPLVSAVGLSNLAGRILLGVIGHYPGVDITLLFIASYVLTGVGALLLTVLTSFTGQIVCAVIYGVFSGAFGPVLTEVTCQIVGVQNFSYGYGFLMLSMATGNMLGAPSAGWLYDYSLEYGNSFYLGGSAFVVSGLVMVVPWLIGLCSKRLQRSPRTSAHEVTLDVDSETSKLPVDTV